MYDIMILYDDDGIGIPLHNRLYIYLLGHPLPLVSIISAPAHSHSPFPPDEKPSLL